MVSHFALVQVELMSHAMSRSVKSSANVMKMIVHKVIAKSYSFK